MDAAPAIRPVNDNDLPTLADIYNYYIEHTVISFETAPVDSSEFARRVDKVRSAGHHWLVATMNGQPTGYAYSGPWNERAAYRHSAEVSVYLHPECCGRGLGYALYSALFNLLGDQDIHTVIAGIALPNENSERLHEKMGMHKAAHYKEVGYKFGQWIDVGYWQVLLGQSGGKSITQSDL